MSPQPAQRAPCADPQLCVAGLQGHSPQATASTSTKTTHPTQASLTTHLRRQQATCPRKRHSTPSISQGKDSSRSSVPITSPTPAPYPPHPTLALKRPRAMRTLGRGLGQAEDPNLRDFSHLKQKTLYPTRLGPTVNQ